MSYTSQTLLEQAISAETVLQLTDDTGAGSVDTDVLAQAISHADGVVDGYLRKRYDIPIAVPTQLIRHLSTSIAAYMLFARRAQVFGGVPDWIEFRYRESMKKLESINKGDLDLGIEPPPAESSAQVGEFDGEDQLFTADTLKDYV